MGLLPQLNVGLVHLNIVVYAFGFWVTNPSMPFLLKEYGASSLSFGYFASLFNVVQLVGGLTVGNLQDRYTGTAAMNITQLGSAFVYFIMFSATNLEMLYVSRIFTILQQSMQVAQAFISKATDEVSRPVALGRISLSYGIGMVLGSNVNGIVSGNFGTHAPFLLAVVLTIVMVAVNVTLLRESKGAKAPDAKQKKDGKSDEPAASLTSYLRIIRSVYPVLGFLLFLYSTKSMYETVYNLTLIEQFKVEQKHMGTLLSGFAAASLLTNVAILPLLMKMFSEDNVTRLSIVGSVLAYVGSALCTVAHVEVPEGETDYVRWGYLACLGVLAMFSSALYTTSTSFISRQTPKSMHGQSVALSHALRSLVGIGCPIIATQMYKNFGGASVAYANAGLLVLALIFMFAGQGNGKEADAAAAKKKKQ